MINQNKYTDGLSPLGARMLEAELNRVRSERDAAIAALGGIDHHRVLDCKHCRQMIKMEFYVWIEDAAHVIEAFIGYSKEMKKLGRGFSPSGLAGHTHEDVAMALRALLALYGEDTGGN